MIFNIETNEGVLLDAKYLFLYCCNSQTMTTQLRRLASMQSLSHIQKDPHPMDKRLINNGKR